MPDAKEPRPARGASECGVTLHQPFLERFPPTRSEFYFRIEARMIFERSARPAIRHTSGNRPALPIMLVFDLPVTVGKTEHSRPKCDTQPIRQPLGQEENHCIDP